MDKDDYFDKWFEESERSFHCGHMTDKDIAYSAFCEGIRFTSPNKKLSEIQKMDK